MELYFYRNTAGNFGDELNTWLWPQLLPRPIAECFDAETLFVGIGTLLNDLIPARPAKKIVFGSGYGYGPPPAITGGWRFFCVRGPLTAARLGLPASTAVSDGALLLRELVEPAATRGAGAAFMPHHRTAEGHAWREVCASLSLRYLDPVAPVEETLRAIRESALVVTEAMHGAIAADALRVPWIPVRTRRSILPLKWEDWSRSIEIEHGFEWLPPIWSATATSGLHRTLHLLGVPAARLRLAWLVRHGRPRLSREPVFQRVYARMRDALQGLVAAAGR